MVQAVSRAARTLKVARRSSTGAVRASTVAITPVANSSLISAFDGFENGVHPLEIVVTRIRRPGRAAHLFEHRDNAPGEIAVDVGVHAGKRELERVHVRRRSRREQRPPGGRRGIGPRLAGSQSVEIEIGKDDVEALEEGRVAEGRRGGHGGPNAKRDAQVEVVEPPEAVGFLERQLDGRHDADDLVN